jgi:hypothetical protein
LTKQIDIQHLAPARLMPNPWNSNRVGPEMEERLRASIAEFGLYKPIVVRELIGDTFEILGGEHRWRVACDMGLQTVPVVSVGVITDKKAKLLGLADNGQYGEDDSLMLAAILRDIGQEDVSTYLPYTDEDMAGMFAAADVDLDSLGFDDEEMNAGTPMADSVRPGVTHELMRFKVPIEDRERVQKLIEKVIADNGLKAETDSMVAAGMALVVIANAARESL